MCCRCMLIGCVPCTPYSRCHFVSAPRLFCARTGTRPPTHVSCPPRIQCVPVSPRRGAARRKKIEKEGGSYVASSSTQTEGATGRRLKGFHQIDNSGKNTFPNVFHHPSLSQHCSPSQKPTLLPTTSLLVSQTPLPSLPAMAALSSHASATGSAWSKFNAASATVKAAARRRLRSSSTSSDDNDAGVARQLLRESWQAAIWASTKTQGVGPTATVQTNQRIQRRLLTWAELGMFYFADSLLLFKLLQSY